MGLRVWGGGQLVDALVSVCAKVVALRLRQGVSHSIIKGLIRFHSIVKRFNHSIVKGSVMVFHLTIQGFNHQGSRFIIKGLIIGFSSNLSFHQRLLI